jgi:putative transcriptional regulator
MLNSLRGQCLIAAKSLRDPNFYKTVVLMLEHTEQGATGLVLNRPSSVCVAHALSGHFTLPETDDVVFVGGPVEPTALLILHDAESLGCSDSSPAPGVFVGGSAESFEQVLLSSASDDEDRARFRVFSGYSGWGEGQLDGEVERGDWLIHSGSHDLVFETDPYEVYDVALQLFFGANDLLPYRVKDPTLN